MRLLHCSLEGVLVVFARSTRAMIRPIEMVTKGSGNTFHIDRGAVPATIPYILKGYCQLETRSILADMCRLKEQDQWV
jgi:hypothetical protein